MYLTLRRLFLHGFRAFLSYYCFLRNTKTKIKDKKITHTRSHTRTHTHTHRKKPPLLASFSCSMFYTNIPKNCWGLNKKQFVNMPTAVVCFCNSLSIGQVSKIFLTSSNFRGLCYLHCTDFRRLIRGNILIKWPLFGANLKYSFNLLAVLCIFSHSTLIFLFIIDKNKRSRKSGKDKNIFFHCINQ